MSPTNLARRGVLAAALLLGAAACSSGNGSTVPSTTAATTAASTAPSGSEAATTTTTTAADVRLIEVTYAGGQVAGGAQRATVARGQKVRIRVTSDIADEVHVHTYDLKADVGPGRPAQVDLVASIPGRHEVELEKKRTTILTLQVS